MTGKWFQSHRNTLYVHSVLLR